METEVQNDMYINQSTKILVDNSIQGDQLVSFIPLSKADFNQNSRTIEINIPAGDAYYLPSKSFLKITGRLVRGDNDAAYAADAQIALINNAMMYLFSNIEYWLGGQKIETLNYAGQTTSMLGYLTYPEDFNSGLSQCWRKDTNVNAISSEFAASAAIAADAAIPAGRFTPQRNPNYNEGFAIRRKLIMDNDTPGQFSFNIPFSHMFGFAEYNKILWNMRHTLKLTRANDNLAIHRVDGVAAGKIVLTDIRWLMPEIIPSIEMQSTMLQFVKDKIEFPVHFCRRTDDHASIPPNERNFVHNISTDAGVEKPRWIIVGFQTNRTTTQDQNPAVFDHCNLTNASVKLANNSEKYPKDDTSEVNFVANEYVDFYNMTYQFKKEYYEINNLIGGSQLDMINYKKLFPLIVFDVRRQSERVKSATMNIKVSLQFSQPVPANTSMYYIIISDRVMYLSSDGKTPKILQ